MTSAVPCLLSGVEIQCPCGFQSSTMNDLFDSIRQKQTNGKPNEAIQFTDVLAAAFSEKTEEESRAVFQLLFTTDCRSHLNNFSVPTVILQVGSDKMSTSEAGYLMYRSIPQSQLIRIKAKGQLPYIDTPAEIVKAIKVFTYSSSF